MKPGANHSLTSLLAVAMASGFSNMRAAAGIIFAAIVCQPVAVLAIDDDWGPPSVDDMDLPMAVPTLIIPTYCKTFARLRPPPIGCSINQKLNLSLVTRYPTQSWIEWENTITQITDRYDIKLEDCSFPRDGRYTCHFQFAPPPGYYRIKVFDRHSLDQVDCLAVFDRSDES